MCGDDEAARSGLKRLRQAEAQSVAPMDATDTGLEAMRGALKATQDAEHGPPEKKQKAAKAPPAAEEPVLTNQAHTQQSGVTGDRGPDRHRGQ